MLLVAFNLGRASEVALHQKRTGVSAERHRGGVIHGTARNDFFRLAHVRNDCFERKLDASSHPGEPQRRAHDLEESAAGNGVEPFGSALRKFAMQGVLKVLASGELFERAPVFRAGLLFGNLRGVMRRGSVHFFADGGEVEFFTRADIFFLPDLNQSALIISVVRH